MVVQLIVGKISNFIDEICGILQNAPLGVTLDRVLPRQLTANQLQEQSVPLCRSQDGMLGDGGLKFAPSRKICESMSPL